MEAEILVARVNLLVALAIGQARPQRGPSGHEELLLVRLNIDDAVLVLHQVFEAGSCVENWRDRHWRAHETKERHCC